MVMKSDPVSVSLTVYIRLMLNSRNSMKTRKLKNDVYFGSLMTD